MLFPEAGLVEITIKSKVVVNDRHLLRRRVPKKIWVASSIHHGPVFVKDPPIENKDSALKIQRNLFHVGRAEFLGKWDELRPKAEAPTQFRNFRNGTAFNKAGGHEYRFNRRNRQVQNPPKMTRDPFSD